MEFQLTLEAGKIHGDSLLRAADVRPLAEAAFPVLHMLLSDIFHDIFESEGIPTPWAALAERTVDERISLGFEGEHPILYRTGALHDSFVDPNHPLHIYDIEVGPQYAVMRVGSADDRVVDLTEGDFEANLPPRPIIPDGTLVFPEMQASLDHVAEALYA